MSEQNSRYNASGCRDNTAYEAINSITSNERDIDKRAYDTIKIIKLILKFGNFDLLNRISIKDKDTGKEYR